MYKLGGILGIVYVFIILIWIAISAVYQGVLYPNEALTVNEGLIYYSDHQWYFGMDHGSKAIAFLLVSILPLILFCMFNRSYHGKKLFLNLLGMIFGFSYFMINAVSLIVQAVTATFAINQYSMYLGDREFARLLFEWAINDGGFSISLYIIANLCMVIWLFAHGYLFYLEMNNKYFFAFSSILAAALLIGAVINFIGIILFQVSVNTLSEMVNILFIFWISYVSYLLFNLHKEATVVKW
ncbi:hypothetical protein ACDX78_07080 [Virgibacillus oceani]